MASLRAAYPRREEILDECSPGGITPTPTAEIAIGSLRNWASAVVMWNLVLDPSGGPVQPPNHGCPGCIGLMTVDRSGASATPTRSFYELGQFSAFVARGARRVASNHFVTYAYPHRGVNVVTPGLDDVALRNPDGSLVLVAYDNSARPVHFSIRWRSRALSYTLSPGATVTFVWNRVR
jgi:glucosylceramidase